MMTRIRVRGPHGDIDRSIQHGPGPAPTVPSRGGVGIGHMTERPNLKGVSWHNWDTPQSRRPPPSARREHS